MLYLHAFVPSFDQPSSSPFCVKAMCMLKITDSQMQAAGRSGLDWVADFKADVRKAPKQKLPVLIDGDQTIADSNLIRLHLEQTYGADFDLGLNKRDLAVSKAMIRMVEEHTYFAVLSDRWMNDESWLQIRDTFFADVPKLVRKPLAGFIRKQVIKQALGQGMGRLSEQERADRIAWDFQAVTDLLGQKPFLFGDTPMSADISVVCVINSLRVMPVETPLKTILTENIELMAYLKRGMEALYPADIKSV